VAANRISDQDRERWRHEHPEPPIEFDPLGRLEKVIELEEIAPVGLHDRRRRTAVIGGVVCLAALFIAAVWVLTASTTGEQKIAAGSGGPVTSSSNLEDPAPSLPMPSPSIPPATSGEQGQIDADLAAAEVTRRVEQRPDVFLGVSAGPNGRPIVAIAAGQGDEARSLLGGVPAGAYEVRTCRLTVDELAGLRSSVEQVVGAEGLGFAYSFDAASCSLNLLVAEPSPAQLDRIESQLGTSARITPSGPMGVFANPDSRG
jgi:hypothetical protein